MGWHVWWMYVATVFVVSAIPGPNMLLVMTHSARFGMRTCVATMAGCLSALLLMFSISAAGLGVFLSAWPTLFNVLRYAGAAYLIYLGIKSWRSSADAVNAADRLDPLAPSGVESSSVGLSPVGLSPAHRSLASLFRSGFLVASSNPKAILFAAALFPQFISELAPKLPQFAVLIATFVVIEVSWYAVYAGFGSRIGEQLRSRHIAQLFNRLTGGIFVGFGAMMALVRH
jgi:threonine/homoserine/homoserine lactone efflux protein